MNERPINILLIEDTESDAVMVQRFLRASTVSISAIHWVESLVEAKSAITKQQFDIIITDLGLRCSSGIETISRLRASNVNMPILAMTSENICDGNISGLAVIRAGADDYIPKDEINPSVISRAVSYTIERSRMAEKISDANKKLHEANRSLESKNKRLEKMCEMSQQFVDNVSHEFRTPLTVIREFASIVKDGIDGPVTETQQTRLGALINRTDDLANMIDDLLDTSQLESGLLRTCREEHKLQDVIQQVERMLRTRAQSKRINLHVSTASPEINIFCDDEKLRRVLINLTVNAIKFTPIGGQILISAEIADENCAVVTVSDNGAGIPSDDLKRIFERFQQVDCHHRLASCKGFGLGLSIARSLAMLNLGSLQVASEAGKGSQFSVTIPLAKTESIMNCYLDQRIAATQNSKEIRILEITPGAFSCEDQEEALCSIDDFLRNNAQTFDLVLQTSMCRWLIFTNSSESEANLLEKRLTKEWASLRRNHYGASLPDLIFSLGISADAETEREKLVTAARSSVASNSNVSQTAVRAKRVLIIDDELDVSNAVQSRLESNGFDVETAFDGKTGLDTVRQSLPDAILLDIRMPVMDGLTVLRHLKEDPKTASTPVVILSASLRDKQKVLDSGADFFIRKPFKSKAILEAIDSAIGMQS
jgi:signal transduction histidine kinase